MANDSGVSERFRGIAFIASYVPRACGIATFTDDLATAVAAESRVPQPVIVAAMNDNPAGYAYPDRVKFEIRQDYPIDYSRAADFLNFSRIDVVCLQHEYGIYGGEWGSNILALLRDLRRPLVVTCHTVIPEQSPLQRQVFEEVCARAEKIVVMGARAVEMLQEFYHVPKDKIALVPHGIHDVPFVDPNYYKDKFGVEGRRVVLTFGLLHENKGIEYMIDALPHVVERHPKTTYLILGATHPNVLRQEGEAYRLRLQRRVRDLGVEDNVLFHPRYVELDELLEYLGATDIFVAPYLAEAQITSGALAYALGSGKAVVSTPFWHAEEALADGRGVLVPFRDSSALADAVNSLLDDEVRVSAMRKKAYTYSRRMVWRSVARDYLGLFDEVRRRAPRVMPTASAVSRPITPSNLPVPKIDHLLRLSDDTGPSHHARYTVPDWSYGYHLEDACRVLVASAKYQSMFADASAARLTETCLGLLHVLVGDGRTVAASLDYSRHRAGVASEEAKSKVLWSLGYLVSRMSPALVAPSHDLFQLLLPQLETDTPVAQAFAVLGAANCLLRFPGATEIRRALAQQADSLLEASHGDGVRNGTEHAVVPQALSVAGAALGRTDLVERGRAMVSELLENTQNGTVFLKPGDPGEEESPVVAATFIEALGAALRASGERELLKPIRAAADWFLGANRVGMAMYDFATGGCYDALSASGPNRNQGAEASAYCLLAFLSLHELAGEKTPLAETARA